MNDKTMNPPSIKQKNLISPSIVKKNEFESDLTTDITALLDITKDSIYNTTEYAILNEKHKTETNEIKKDSPLSARSRSYSTPVRGSSLNYGQHNRNESASNSENMKRPVSTLYENSEKLSPRSTSVSRTSSNFRPVFSIVSTAEPSPTAMSFAEFKRTDIRARKQRIVMYALEKHEMETRIIHKKNSKVKKKDTLLKRNVSLPKWGVFLPKKRKKKTCAGSFHLISMAIRDNRTSYICSLLDDISPSDLQKHKREAERIFLQALSNGMENVCMVMLEKGIPSNITAPILNQTGFNFPSYFILAVGLGFDNVVRAMLK
ncbi:hypothetical protein HK096_000943, partial [Nowakowskiella sp. JEL0078]